MEKASEKYFCENELTTGWQLLIGSPKLQIIFHKRATKYRALLWKMTYKDKGSYQSSPPCTLCLPTQYICTRMPNANGGGEGGYMWDRNRTTIFCTRVFSCLSANVVYLHVNNKYQQTNVNKPTKRETKCAAPMGKIFL